jgi:hypothetical protein
VDLNINIRPDRSVLGPPQQWKTQKPRHWGAGAGGKRQDEEGRTVRRSYDISVQISRP